MKTTKPRKPSWKADNDPKLLSACGLEHWDPVRLSKENNKLRKFLMQHGWVYWDSCNIYEVGLTWTFKKKIEGKGLQKPTVSFDWHWDQEMGEPYFHGKLRGCFDLYPNDKFYHPTVFTEIDPILEKHLKHLDLLENRVIDSLFYLTVVE